MQHVDPAHRTIYADLAQRALDVRFANDFPLEGRFIRWRRNEREYWYFDRTDESGKKVRRYVGPVADAEITRRVAEHKELKNAVRQRRRLVSALVRDARLPTPDRTAGDVVAALADAGFFRLRGVLVGTVAYGCYPAYLGIRLADALQRTQDTDLAQFHSISVAVDDTTDDVREVLRVVDPTFDAIPDQMDGRRTTKFVNAEGYRVEFLTPNRTSDDVAGKPARMPALGGVDAVPLRFLDFLIYEPVRAVMLHRAGVPVTIPAPERYAVHKLIVASRRRKDGSGEAKDRKDLNQAVSLFRAMIELRRSDDLADAWMEARDRGPAWRTAIDASVRRLSPSDWANFQSALRSGVETLGASPAAYGLANSSD